MFPYQESQTIKDEDDGFTLNRTSSCSVMLLGALYVHPYEADLMRNTEYGMNYLKKMLIAVKKDPNTV